MRRRGPKPRLRRHRNRRLRRRRQSLRCRPLTGTLHGHITDPSGALIPGTQVTITTADGKKVGNATADAAGAYQVHGLPAGSYVIAGDI